jgi:intracellular sulfur oxidation DsrE/DsrF family protein
MGIRFQQCGLSLSNMKVDRADVLHDIEIVKNGYVSLIAYQNKGYALIPMD